MKKLILIDGHALIFKMYYAFLRRPMVNSKGADTSILFGFTKTLLELILKEKPTHFAVAFDPPAKTFRHEIFPEYKANRSETPELIKSSLEPLCTLMEAISVPVLMKDGYEADDVIGTFAKKAEKEGHIVYMVTPDKDYGQLVSDNIFQYKPGKGGSQDELLGKEQICSMYGIEEPIRVIDILSIWGDASDNIPGVRGVGEVGAKKLIAKYKTLENIYENLEELPERQRDSFIDAKPHISLSKKLVTIETNVELDWNEKDLELSTPDFTKIKHLFAEYEFTSLSRMLPQLQQLFDAKPGNEYPVTNESSGASSKELAPWKLSDAISVAGNAKKEGYISFALSGETLLAGSGSVATILDNNGFRLLGEIISDPAITKTGYDLKSMVFASREAGVSPAGYLADVELMHYVITPERSHKLDTLSKSYLDISIAGDNAPADLFSELPPELPYARALKEFPLLYPLCRELSGELEKEKMADLYNNIEMPLIVVLSDMEREGVKIDTGLLAEYSKELTSELAGIESNVRELAGEPTLNISSPKQLGVVLYEKLQLVKNAKRTSKKNYSTDEETLSSILDSHPIIPLILEYRNIKKLLSTYIDPLPYLISPVTGKIHTTYNQALTSTGRLSSVKPNLQNIPIRTERGREIRKAFIPSNPGGVIMSADYSQIELRLMAHMSQDPHFIEAFRAGKDIHAATASKIFGIPEEELSREQRNRAKVANFGIIYGISAFGLSQRLSIPRGESKKLIEDYFTNYPQVEEYMNQMISKAKEVGYVTTLYGRKRYLPDITSRNPVVRGLAERNAINAPIQGSAADIIKAAMINVAKRIQREELKSRMILQVHDELVFDAYEEEVERLTLLVKQEMESVIELSVPLTVECNWGANWLEAH
ncbi:MAG: DNA polymerase I [Rikenellaceae bacterium]|nr:DNA polymerase I [Rikenellaceae bacterium]